MKKIALLPVFLLCLALLSGCDALQSGSGRWSGALSLYWSEPLQRVDGSPLALTDIMGYEIRYRQKGESQYESVFIDGYSVDSYHLDNLPDPANTIVEIAVIDKNGLYSDFVTAE